MKISKTEVYGFKSALRSMRNPMNSWNLGDSDCRLHLSGEFCIEHNSKNDIIHEAITIGKADLKLAQNLILAGNEHSKFLRSIQVWTDIDMPRYFWSEFDTYGYNTKNSCSTMHKLLNKQTPIKLEMFEYCEEDLDILHSVIDRLNEIREQHNNSNNQKEKDYLLLRAKRLLPEGFLQLRTVNTNYAELRNMYFQRRHHRLKEEWIDTFCKWVESLPYAKELIMIEKKLTKDNEKFNKVITLCGSTKFKDDFLKAQKELTLQGNIVISVGLFGHSGDNEVWSENTKEMLDNMHKRKIDMADEIFVINVNGYIGSSTKSEIEYAIKTNKKVNYLVSIK